MGLREECDGCIRRLSLIILWVEVVVVCFALLEARNHEVSVYAYITLLKRQININQPLLCPLCAQVSTKLRAATDDDVAEMLEICIFTFETVVKEVSYQTLSLLGSRMVRSR